MSIKYQVFISSTFGDLEREREQVIKAVLEMGHIPVGMEMFSAGDDEQWSVIARQIEEVDYYAVIVAHRYGSVTSMGVGYTEKEYDYAVAKGVPILGFVLADKAPWPSDRHETEEAKRIALESFRGKVKSRMVNFWTTKDDLHAKFSIALMKAFTTHKRTGWARADETTGVEVTRELSRLSAENAQLRRELAEASQLKGDTGSGKRREAFAVLERNRVITNVRKKADDWGPDIPTTLLAIFEAVATALLVETDINTMAKSIAFELTNATDYYRTYPIPSNHLKGWLADLHALDLIEPSRRRHPVADTNEYWSLTEFGRSLLKEFRRIRLEVSIEPAQVQPPEVEGEV